MRHVERRRDRAESDIRAAHAIALGLIHRFAGEAWRRARGSGWSPAEVLLHLVLVEEKVLEGLRIVATGGPLARPKTRSLRQRVAARSLLVTWRFPRGLRPIPGTAPEGVVLTPADLEDRHTRAAGGYIELLRCEPPALLERLYLQHEIFGDLDAFEWGVYLRAHARHHELQLG